MKLISIILIILFAYNPVIAGEKWNKVDKALFTTFTATQIADYSQTKHIFEHPDKFKEYNPLLRKMGKDALPYLFGGYILGTWYITDKLKSKHRKILLIILTSISIALIINNTTIGVGFSF